MLYNNNIECFGREGYIRISYATSLPGIEKGMKAFKEFLARLG